MSRYSEVSKKSKWMAPKRLLPVFVVLAAAVVLALIYSSSGHAPEHDYKTPATHEQKPKKPVKPTVPLADLQPVLDNWLKSQSAHWSIEVTDVYNQKVIASHDPDSAFFTASLYKPYVAYFGYRKMTNGSFTDTPDYQAGRSRMQCLDLMIRKSDSPCGEKMMAELGRPWMDTQLPALGMKCTSLVALTTCAHDMNDIINDIIHTQDISLKYKRDFLKSMDNQIFRAGMEKGFTKVKAIGSKVGFNLDLNYHESSLVTFNDGRQYIITLMSQGQGSPRPLADLAARFQAELLKPKYAPSEPLHPTLY